MTFHGVALGRGGRSLPNGLLPGSRPWPGLSPAAPSPACFSVSASSVRAPRPFLFLAQLSPAPHPAPMVTVSARGVGAPVPPARSGHSRGVCACLCLRTVLSVRTCVYRTLSAHVFGETAVRLAALKWLFFTLWALLDTLMKNKSSLNRNHARVRTERFEHGVFFLSV